MRACVTRSIKVGTNGISIARVNRRVLKRHFDTYRNDVLYYKRILYLLAQRETGSCYTRKV